jgi:hypothetical protein
MASEGYKSLLRISNGTGKYQTFCFDTENGFTVSLKREDDYSSTGLFGEYWPTGDPTKKYTGVIAAYRKR